MKRILFLGNGFNRIDEASHYSWGDLLVMLQEKTELMKIDHGYKPFPMLYEEIYLSGYQKQNLQESELLEMIQAEISKLEPNSLHQQLSSLAFTDYITTNYDDLIERSLSDKPFTTEAVFGLKPEYKYRIRTRNTSGNQHVWHIHGENKYGQTLVLGQKMYNEVVARILDYIEYEMDGIKQTWIDLLFDEEVHMIGYGLSYDDISVWSVLTERARAIVEGRRIKNRIVFHHCIYDMSEQEQLAFQSLLEAHQIEVNYSDKKESYESFYQRMLNQFK